MEVLEKRSPEWVFIQDGMGEPDDLVAMTGDHGELTPFGLGQSTSPHLLAISDDVPIKIGVQVGASVVTSPAVGMEGGDTVGIALGRVEIPHSRGVF